MNRVLEQYLRCFVHSQPTTWFRYLALAEWSYNTSLHSSSGLTPFEITYDKPPPTVLDYIPGTTNNEAVHSLLETRQTMHSKLQRRLKQAQERMKAHADARREDISFEEGQWVYVKLRPGRQSSIIGRPYQKLSKRFFGPFQVLERIGAVAYRLQLPSESRIHPVFHCSLLRLHHGPPPDEHTPCPLLFRDQRPLRKPLCFLDMKIDPSSTTPTPLVLTQWVGEPLKDTSWEPWPELRDTYHLEDKVVLGGEGIVSIAHEGTHKEDDEQAQDDEHAQTSRPTRARARPSHLQDYHVEGLPY